MLIIKLERTNLSKNEAQSKSRRFAFFVCFVVDGFAPVDELWPKSKLAQSLFEFCFVYCGFVDGAIPKSKEKGLGKKYGTFMRGMKIFPIFSTS